MSYSTHATSGKDGRDGEAKESGLAGDGYEACQQFDYLQCSVPDIHGTPRGRIVPKHLVPQILRDGFGLFQGICYFGLHMEISKIPEYVTTNANGIFLPITSTVRPLHWSSSPERRIGHVLCSLLSGEGKPDPSCPRYTAMRQVERLTNMGLTIKSAFELEFKVFEEGDPKRPLGKGRKQYCNLELLDHDLDFFLDLMDTLRQSQLPVELLNNEYDPGQYEITMVPTEGLQSPDAVFLARYGIRAFCRRHGYEATFMTKPTFQDYANGFHLNHSLWTVDGKDVFFDASDPQRLSSFARYWIAGLMHHTPALCALFCPTVNCYRRFNSGLAPNVVYWNFDDRLCTYRVKTSQSGAYLENRLPSSAVNPYIAFAATIAAGLDGVERKLECPASGRPKVGSGSAPVMPRNLGEALDYLNNDTELKEALGGKMVEYFTYIKKEFEIKNIENNTQSDRSPEKVIEIEREYYMPYI